MEDLSFINQWHFNSVDEHSILPLAAAFGENLQQSFSHPNFNNHSHIGVNRPTKQLKTNSWCSSKNDQTSVPQFDSSSLNVLSFVNSNYINQMGTVKPKEEAECLNYTNNTMPSDVLISEGSFGNQNYVFKTCQGAKRISTNAKLSHNQDHIIAERKRREKLSQKFIALSAIVPGLKKMDKASVLGDAIKHLKQLQEKVKTLEEEQSRKKATESVLTVKKSQLLADADNSSSDLSGPFDEELPEIEARFCDENVLIRVHCEKRKGVTEAAITEIEKLHLTVTNSSVMTFGKFALDITIVAKMDVEFSMTLKDLVRNLRSAFKSFM
ncbi:transcription factor bHLH25-like [Quillaja saponaria]|nr:transcription factor bHLH25-like [Quillaja saponaria]